MLAKRRTNTDPSAVVLRSPHNWMRIGESAASAFGGARNDTPEAVSMSVYQLIAGSLEGPNGLQPENFLAALGALAGYGSRWTVRAAIEAGKLDNDFRKPLGVNRPHVLVSEHVNRLVCSLQTQSVAALLASSMMRAGANWLPDVNVAVQHNFEAINSPRYPDYTIPAKHLPSIPPQTLLMMLWEKTQRTLRGVEGGAEMAPVAIAMAAAHAIVVHKAKVPMDVGAQLVLETAIAMSKLDYGL
jgi:hypothetical protein